MLRGKKHYEAIRGVTLRIGEEIIYDRSYPALQFEDCIAKIQADFGVSHSQAYDAISLLLGEGLLEMDWKQSSGRHVLQPKAFPKYEPQSSQAIGSGKWVTEYDSYVPEFGYPTSREVWKSAEELASEAEFRRSIWASETKDLARDRLVTAIDSRMNATYERIGFYLTVAWILVILGVLRTRFELLWV